MGDFVEKQRMFVLFQDTDSLPKITIKVICTVVCVGDIHHCNITPLLGLID